MSDSLVKPLDSPIYKEASVTAHLQFDFYKYTANNLLQIADGRGFVNVHNLNRFLGRRYCLPKEQIKLLLRTMRSLGYLQIEKRGVRLTYGYFKR